MQTAVTPSARACIDALQLLNEGRSMLSTAGSGVNQDLSVYLFKQQSEGGRRSDNPDRPTDPSSYTVGEMRPGLYGQRDNGMTQRDAGEVAHLMDRPSYFATMREIFGQSQYFDLVRNHNQVISTPGDRTIAALSAPSPGETVDAATSAIQSAPDAPTVLLNFDTHSDMYTGATSDDQESIAQWVNSVLQHNPNVNEVYWVLPNDLRDNPDLNERYFAESATGNNVDPVFVNAARDMTVYLSRTSGALLTERPANYSEENYRAIQFHKRTMDELPDFAGRRAAVSIDLDYFDNRGYDTTAGAEVNYRSQQGFADFVEGMRRVNLQPVFTTVSASPEYVRSEHMRDLLRFSSLVEEATNAPTDAVVVPRENLVYPDPTSQTHDGLQVNRQGNQSLEMLYEMFRVDSQTEHPNDSVNLNVESDELRAVIDATKRVYAAQSDEEARQILNRFDTADGNTNGIIEFEAIESLLVRLCRTTPASDIRLHKDRAS